MKNIFLSFTFLIVLSIYSQNTNDKLENIRTIEEAEKFVIDNPELIPEILTLIPENNDEVPSYFKSFEVGQVVIVDEKTYKIITIKKRKTFRVSYIYLDGSKLSMSEINELRPKIIKQFRKGEKFSELAKKYTMDGNKTGDLNWFNEGEMVPEFEIAVKKHKKDEIFTVDVPERKWYYVTLKTHEDKEIQELTILKIKNGI